MRWAVLIAFALVGCGEAAPKPAAPTPAVATPCPPAGGEAEPASRGRMGPGMELARTPATVAAGRGRPMLVTGTVRTEDCRPVAGVTVTAWQANAKGRYGPGRRCCYLTATVRTDSEGRYALDTIVPAAYVGGGEPHIHLEVAGGEIRDVFVEGRPETLRHDIVMPHR